MSARRTVRRYRFVHVAQFTMPVRTIRSVDPDEPDHVRSIREHDVAQFLRRTLDHLNQRREGLGHAP
jgi:hypothetical protein